jgi:non-ribosomal peptide synthetase component E (peptide arylation enzyme)
VFPALRAILTGGRPAGFAELVRHQLGARLLSGYGATECPQVSFCGPQDDDSALERTEGRPTRGAEITVTDEAGRSLPANEVGELRVSGPQRFLGYAETALDDRAIDERGRFCTGDLGLVDDRGYLVITGRIKEIIRRKGESISVREVQDVLATHPDVADVAVLGLPDSLRGERVCAVLVARDPSRPITFEAMSQHCRAAGLMAQKLPEQLEHVEELPRNGMGRVMTGALRERFASTNQ